MKIFDRKSVGTPVYGTIANKKKTRKKMRLDFYHVLRILEKGCALSSLVFLLLNGFEKFRF